MKGSIGGRIETQGPILELMVMATRARVDLLKAANRPYPTPVTVRALLDTGASCSAIDVHILAGLGLEPRGSTLIHTPSSGPALERHDLFDVSVVLSPGSRPRSFTLAAIGAHLAHAGFLALVGWDILGHCDLICRGPSRKFTLRYA